MTATPHSAKASPAPAARLLKAAATARIDAEWGNLTWFANAELGNSEHMTVGRCVLKPGQGNPKHSHPNCSEVLVVAKGRITHTIEGDREVEMGEGDVISIPPNMAHRARNIGEGEAVLMISFSSAYRQVQGE
jgi:quercetin dioxygenase-like cupin family protein